MTSSMCPPIDPTVEVLLTWTDPDTSEAVSLGIPARHDDDPSVSWWWSALSWPFFDYRKTYAPASAWLPGQIMLSAVPDAGTIPISITVQTAAADGQAGLTAAKATLDAAFAAVDLTVTFLLDGATFGSWAAEPSAINWGPVAITTLGMFAQEGAAAVPLNPVEAT